MLTLMGQLSWVPPGQTGVFMAVNYQDTYGLRSNWSKVSGGLLGFGNCSQARLTDAEVVTEIAASTCPGDTDATSSTCPLPTLQPNATAFVGAIGTVETSNLTAIGAPSVTYPNSDLAITFLVSSTSGTCLVPISSDAPTCACVAGATWNPTDTTCACNDKDQGIINGQCVSETCPPGDGWIEKGSVFQCIPSGVPGDLQIRLYYRQRPSWPDQIPLQASKW